MNDESFYPGPSRSHLAAFSPNERPHVKRIFVPVLLVMFATGSVMIPTRLSEATTASARQSAASNTRVVTYKGVSFSVDPALASEVRSQTVPMNAEGKPSDIVPDHPAFTLVAYKPARAGAIDRPHIRVFELKEFRQAMATAGVEMRNSLADPKKEPEWTTYIDGEVRTLKAVLKARPTLANLRQVISRARRGNESMQMPFLPLWEAHQAVVSRLRYVDFQNGKGVFFLTQWDTDTSLISNAGLQYAYQGITNDGRYYVYAEFPVNAPFLPKGDEPDVVAWSVKNYLMSHESAEYQKYVGPVAGKLEVLPANQFQPNLELLERLVQSLEVGIDKKR